MAEEKVGKKVDSWFEKVEGYITKKIGAFVAFLFLLVAFGAFMALVISQRWPEYSMFTVLVPGAAGILAYYNRAVAVALFAMLMLFVFLL